MRDDIVCMYACPSVPWKKIPTIDPTEPLEPNVPGGTWPTIANTPTIPQKDMGYFKREFIRLFKEMEWLFGKCKAVKIEHERGDDVNADISF